MKTILPLAVCAGAVAILSLGGCAHTGGPARSQSLAVSSSLIMPSAAMRDLDDSLQPDEASVAAAWAMFRNDDSLGALPDSESRLPQYVEVRQREYLRTINGRPREFSTTSVLTIKRGVVQ